MKGRIGFQLGLLKNLALILLMSALDTASAPYHWVFNGQSWEFAVCANPKAG